MRQKHVKMSQYHQEKSHTTTFLESSYTTTANKIATHLSKRFHSAESTSETSKYKRERNQTIFIKHYYRLQTGSRTEGELAQVEISESHSKPLHQS